MRAATLVKLALVTSSFSLFGAAQFSDVCGDVSGVLSLPGLSFPHKLTNYGNINDCICLSHIPSYISTKGFAIAAVAGAGKSAVTASLTQMLNSCHNRQTCHYPPHSVPSCVHGNPCSFTCSDGYTPFPYGRPTDCVCNKPYTVCNGKCGLFKGCPSGRPVYKRGLDDKCARGFTSCPIPGRGGETSECVNTNNDLESCGGCVLPAYPGQYVSGVDCTAIQGVSDVSCIRGQCVVHRCMSGYGPNQLRDSCNKADDESEVVLGGHYYK